MPEHEHTHTHSHTNRCSLRPAAASTLPSVAASDSVCRTWGCSTPGDSLAVRKSCLLFIFTARHSPTLGHSHPCNTSKNLYLPALAAFPPPPFSSRDPHQQAYLRAEPCKYTLNACFYQLCYIALRGTKWLLLVFGRLFTSWDSLSVSGLRMIIWPRVETANPRFNSKRLQDLSEVSRWLSATLVIFVFRPNLEWFKTKNRGLRFMGRSCPDG